jgi:serine/threonine protein kinase
MGVSDHQTFRGTDRFLIHDQLGAGAFGTVYRAYDRERNAVVALKVLRQTNPDALYRFKREFRALADVSHANLATLYELMTDGTHWFFTMELVEGVSFLQYVRGSNPVGHLSVDSAASTVLDSASPEWVASRDSVNQVFEKGGTLSVADSPSRVFSRFTDDTNRLRPALLQLAEGVNALHQAGQIHRDIKPSNVLVTAEGRVVLLDFGLVTELVPEEFRQSLTFVGTPAYMSPEQASELPVTAASDWYCVGVMLYEALTGRLPFTGPLLEVLNKKQNEEPQSTSEICADVPEDLDSLCREFLRRNPDDRPTGPEVINRLRSGTACTANLINSSVEKRASSLIGRDRHLILLQEALAQTQKGHAVTVYLQGSSGMGKTALGHHFLEAIRRDNRDAVVLTGRCYEQESVPYKALDNLIDNISRFLKRLPPAAAEALMPRDILALARLFPVLRQVNAVASARRRVLEIPDSQELRRRASSALRELLARLADQRPTIIFLDDLQWGDVDSAVLLGELQRPPDPPPLLLIAAYRTEEAEASPLLQTLFNTSAAYSKYVETQQITVGELPFSEARELALSFLDKTQTTAEARAEVIARESAGNPFFINELVRFSKAHSAPAQDEVRGLTPPGKIPLKETSLEELILSRVIRLPAPVRRLLEIAAVAGRPLELVIAKRAADVDVEEYAALVVLRADHLIQTRGTGAQVEIVTYHDRIRETIIANLSPEILRTRHYRLALALETSGRADPEMLTVHFQRAEENARAAEYAVIAAEKASEALAFERASQLYRRALELRSTAEPGRLDLRAKLGDALANAGRSAEAAAVYIEAAEAAPSAIALELKRKAAEQLLRSGHVDKGLKVVKTVLDSVGMKLPPTPRRALAAILIQRAITRVRGLNFREHDVSQLTAEDLTRIDICWSLAIGLARVDNIRAAYFQSLHLRFALRAGEPYRVVRALAAEAGFAATAGGPGKQRTEWFLAAVESCARRIDHPHALALATFAPAFAAFYQGHFRIALEKSEQAETIFRERCTGVTWEINTAQTYTHSSLYYMGEIHELTRRVPLRLREAHERGDLYAAADAGASRSNIIWLAADDIDGARQAIREAMKGWSLQGFHAQHLWELFAEGQVEMYAGNGERAWERITSRWPALAASLILRVQFNRIESVHLRGRSALAAVDAGADPEFLLISAENDAKLIENEQMDWAKPFSHLLRAGIAYSRGDQERSLSLLAEASSCFNKAEMSLYAKAAERRTGELIGGEDGRALVTSSNAWMAGQRIQNVDAMTALLAPGFVRA